MTKNHYRTFYRNGVSNKPDPGHHRALRLSLAVFVLVLGFLSLKAIAQDVEEEVVKRAGASSIPREVDNQFRRAARKSGFSLLKGAGLVWGMDDNIHRSPENLEESGTFWSNWGLLRADKRFSKKERLMSTFTWEQTQYPSNSSANAEQGELRNWYTRPLTDNTSIELSFGIRHRNNDPTDINGKKYLHDYSYWRYAANGLFVWNISREHQFKVGGGYTLRDYGEVSGLNSQDWQATSLKTQYRYRFGKFHYLKLKYSLSERKYDEELAGLRYGFELPTNPEEKHRYQTAKVSYELPINNRLYLDLGYSYESKNDLFQDYESYGSQDLQANLRLKANKKTEITMGAAYTTRHYDNILGDASKKLNYDLFSLGLGVQYMLWDSAQIDSKRKYPHPTGWFFANANYYDRDSNKSFGILYRDRKGLVLSMGLGIYF